MRRTVVGDETTARDVARAGWVAGADGVVRVGLTGGIASGKSTVSQMLGERGAVIIDYDRLSRDVVAVGTQGLARVVEPLGVRFLLLMVLLIGRLWGRSCLLICRRVAVLKPLFIRW